MTYTKRIWPGSRRPEKESGRFVQVLSLVFLIFTLGIIITGYYYYRNQEKQFRAGVERHLLAVLDLKIHDLRHWREERLSDGEVFFQNENISRRSVQLLDHPEDGENKQRLFVWLKKIKSINKYDDVFLLDTHGVQLLSAAGSEKETAPHLTDVIEKVIASGEVEFIDFHRHSNNGKVYLSVVVPVYESAKGSRSLGVLVLQIDPYQYLYPFIQRWPSPSGTAETLLVRRDGDEVLFLNDLRFEQGAALIKRIPLTQTDLPAVMAVMGREGIVTGMDYRSVPVIAAIGTVPDSLWFIVARMDLSEVYAPLREKQWRVVFLIALLILAAGGGVGVIWRQQRIRHFRTRLRDAETLFKSEQRHRATLMSVGDAVIATDSEGRVEMFNPVAEALTGWTIDEARGKPIEEVFQIVNEETREKVESPVNRVMREGIVVGLANHTVLISKNGKEHPIADSGAPIRGTDGTISGVVMVFQDTTEEQKRRNEREIRFALLRLLNEPSDTRSLAQKITIFLQKRIGCDVVGVRLKAGDDFPYYETIGFSDEFIKEESSLFATEANGQPLLDNSGKSVLACMCGNVISGRTDPEQPFFTSRGSFWSNNTSELQNCQTLSDGRTKSRHTCNANGYESVALIRLQTGEQTLGLLQLNDRRKNFFTLDHVSFLENVADQIALAFAQKIAEGVLRERERQLSNAVNIAHLGPWEYDVINDQFLFNDHFYRLFHTTADKVGGYTMTSAEYARRFVHPDDVAVVGREIQSAIEAEDTRQSLQLEHRMKYADGDDGFIATRFFIVKDEDGRTVRTYGINQDITERKKAEEERKNLEIQLIQSQKMEAIGRLAGGIAHDFNNILTAIQGFADLMLMSMGDNDPMRDDCMQIVHAAETAASLTQQLLAFSRKQIISPRIINLNKAVARSEQMLKRIIGENIDLVFKPYDNLWRTRLDPTQVDQILVNLAVNARDAMTDTGNLTIETKNLTLEVKSCQSCNQPITGDFVLLAVSDTGAGMDGDTLNNIFDPFFTTKEKGKGTGLGLATVHGVVHQNHGHINVYSEQGMGTTLKIYLPRAIEEVEDAERVIESEQLDGIETILLVEDQEQVRNLTERILKSYGYNVILACDGEDALLKNEKTKSPIDLLLTDVVMPQMNGKELSERILRVRPHIGILFMSGYTNDVIAQHGLLERGTQFIEKPFRPQELAKKIREILDAGLNGRAKP